MKDPAGNAAPAGGFKNKGWYSGYNYYNGQFASTKGAFAPGNPDGSGTVSPEVNAQSAAKQGVSTQQFNQFLTTQDVQNHLNGVQNDTFTNYQSPDIPQVESTAQIAQDLKDSGLLPTATAPTPPNLVDTYNTLKDQSGVEAIQTDINNLKAKQDQIASQLQVNKTAENNKPVAQNVIEGRISTETQQAQDQYDFIGRQLARKQDEMNAALTNIQQIMQFTQQDYANASQAYNTQFDQAISMINLVHGIQQDQKTDVQRAQDNARANLQIYVNAITSGNLDVSSLDPAQQAQLNKLEVQSGLPVGFVQSLHIDPSKSILYTGKTSNGQIQVLMRNPDGSISSQLYGSATSGSTATKAELNSKAIQLLQSNANSYGDVSPQVWQQIRAAYIQDGGTASEFNSEFSGYADTNRGDFENAYGFKNPSQ